MVNLTRMKILAEITITTFDEQEQIFGRGLENLSKDKKNRIYHIIRYNSTILYFDMILTFSFQGRFGSTLNSHQNIEEKSKGLN